MMPSSSAWGSQVFDRPGRSPAGVIRGGYRPVGKRHPVTFRPPALTTIRVAYDDGRYVRLAVEAFAGWRALEAAQGVTLLVEQSGEVDLGPDVKLDALAAAMRATDVPFDELDATVFGVDSPNTSPRCGLESERCSMPKRERCLPTRRCVR